MITVIDKIELPKKEDILCPLCGKNCNGTGLRVILGVLQPCEECMDLGEYERWSKEDQIQQHIAKLNP